MTNRSESSSGGYRRGEPPNQQHRGRKTGIRKSSSHNTFSKYAPGGTIKLPDNGGYSSNVGDMLQNAFKDSLGAVNSAAQTVAPPVTIKAKPKNRPGAGVADAGGGSSVAMPDYLDQLMQSMLTDSASQTFDYESAIKQSEGAIRGAYAAEIGAIRGNNRAAVKDTRKARREIERMYNGLAKSYGRDSQVATQRGNADAAKQMQLAADANKTITDSQQASTQQEAQMLKDLGLEATADQIIAPDFKQTQKVTSENTQKGLEKAQTAREFAGADSRYFTRSAGGARFEGKGRSADLLSQLQDYIRGNRGQIAQLKGQRAKEVADNKLQAMQAAADAKAKADADLWSRIQDAANLKIKVEDTNNDNALAASKFQYQQKSDAANRQLAQLKLQMGGKTSSNLPKGIQSALNIVGDSGEQKQKLASVLQGLWNTDPFKDGSVSKALGNGKTRTSKLTPFAAGALAEQAGRKAGLSEKDIRVLKMAAMASAQ